MLGGPSCLPVGLGCCQFSPRGDPPPLRPTPTMASPLRPTPTMAFLVVEVFHRLDALWLLVGLLGCPRNGEIGSASQHYTRRYLIGPQG